MIYPKISIIIPIYNVEAYLDRCVESVVKQTYKNLEIILVDDGSPDNCPSICDEWGKKDERIKVIHKKNGGLSDARNAGIKVATGKLIGFVDSDDWIAENMYQLLYENMKEHDSDIAACGVEMVFEDGRPSVPLTTSGSYIMKTQEAIKEIINESIIKQPVWYKLYKTELIRDIVFPVGKYHEDVFWSYQVIGNSKKISVFDTPCYFYFQRKNSIMGNTYSLKRLDILDAKLERIHYLEKYYNKLTDMAKWDLWFSCIYSMQMSLRYLSVEDRKAAEQKINLIKRSIRSICFYKGIPIKQRVWFCFSIINFKNICRIRNFLKVGL